MPTPSYTLKTETAACSKAGTYLTTTVHGVARQTIILQSHISSAVCSLQH